MNIFFQGINSPPDRNMGPDHIYYDLLAQNIAKGEGYTLNGNPVTYYPPGNSFLLSLIYYFFGVNYMLARIMYCILGATTCIIIYFICKGITNEKVGIFAAIALAIYPMHFYYSSHFFTEIPWSFFMSIAVLSAISLQQKQKLIFSILLGFFTGFSAYIRPISLMYLPILILLLFIYRFPYNKKKILTLYFIPLFIFIISISPWIIRNYKVTGHIVPMTTQGGFVFLSFHHENALSGVGIKNRGGISLSSAQNEINKIKDVYYREKTAFRLALQSIKKHLRDLPMLEIMKVYCLLTPFYNTPNKLFNLIGGGSWALLFPFCILGIAMTFKKKQFIPLLSTVILILFVTLVWGGNHRFRESIGPFLVIYGCVGFLDILNRLKKFKR